MFQKYKSLTETLRFESIVQIYLNSRVNMAIPKNTIGIKQYCGGRELYLVHTYKNNVPICILYNV